MEPKIEEILEKADAVRTEILNNEMLLAGEYSFPVKVRDNFFYTVRYKRDENGLWNEGEVISKLH